MEQLILIKLGGSIITDKSKPFTAKESVIVRLGKEIYEARKKLKADIIIGHGSGSFGHSVAAKYKTQEGFKGKKSIKGLSLVSDSAVQINRIVVKNLIKIDLPVVSFSPASFIYSNDQRIKDSLIEPVRQALKIGIIPVVYGDIVFDENNGFCIYSGEKILNLLASKLKSQYKSIRIIYCGDTDGVYDGEGNTIPIITQSNFRDYKKVILGSSNIDVTGGMLHKVGESLTIARLFRIDTRVINGTKSGNLLRTMVKDNLEGTTLIS